MSPHEAALARFAAAVSGDPWEVALDEAALALSAVLQPGLDVLHWQVELDELAASCAAPTREGVVRHLVAAGFAGVGLAGIGMPAHFLVGDPHDPDWFVDAFGGFDVLDRTGARQLHARVTGGGAWSEAHLAPVPPRAIVARMLNNLLAGCDPQRDGLRLAQVAAMREVLPEFAAEVREASRRRAVLN